MWAMEPNTAMISRDDFSEQVADTYDHLYDLVYLRTHPLANLLVADNSLTPKEKAWRLHHILTEAINEIDPGPRAPSNHTSGGASN